MSYARGNTKEVAEELEVIPEVLYPSREEFQKFEHNIFLDVEKQN